MTRKEALELHLRPVSVLAYGREKILRIDGMIYCNSTDSGVYFLHNSPEFTGNLPLIGRAGIKSIGFDYSWQLGILTDGTYMISFGYANGEPLEYYAILT